MNKMFLIATLASILLAACGGNPAQELPPAPTTQVPTPIVINTPVPPPTNTLLPTDTPLPLLTNTTSPYSFLDEFNGVLAEGWRWVGENPTKWNLTQAVGSVRIILQPTNINDGEPINFLLRDAPTGNFEISTLVRFTPTSNYQFAGLLIYQSQGNAMQFGRAFANCNNTSVCPGNAIYFDIIEAGKGGKPNFSTLVQNQSQAYLRLRREGGSYSGFYSDNGIDWALIGKHESTLITPLFVGLIGSQAYQEETTADFEYFTIQTLP